LRELERYASGKLGGLPLPVLNGERGGVRGTGHDPPKEFAPHPNPLPSGERGRTESAALLSLPAPDRGRAPERRVGRERDLPEAGVAQHALDLGAREAMLESCAEPVERIRAHVIERAVAVVGERPARGQGPQPVKERARPRQRPVYK